MFLGASLQDLGSVGPSTLDLIDREVERLVGEALEKAAAVLERNWARRRGDRASAARARDALGRRARRGAVDRPADCRSTSSAATGGPPRASASRSGGLSTVRRLAAALPSALAAIVLGAPRAARRRARPGGSSSRCRRASPFAAPLGAPGDLQFLAPNRGLLRSRATRPSRPGRLHLRRRRWHQLATVCGSAGAPRARSPGPARASSGRSPSRASRAPGDGHRALPLQGRRGGRLLQHRRPSRRPVPRRCTAAACTGAERLLVRRARSREDADRRAARRLPPALGRRQPDDRLRAAGPRRHRPRGRIGGSLTRA